MKYEKRLILNQGLSQYFPGISPLIHTTHPAHRFDVIDCSCRYG